MTLLKIWIARIAAVVLMLAGLPFVLGLPQFAEPPAFPIQYGFRILGWCLLGGGAMLFGYVPMKASDELPTDSE